MSQNFQVLRCHQCDVFQVHITKKSKKWECKICCRKQSLKQIYGSGTSKDCRLHTQKLNELNIEKHLDCVNPENDQNITILQSPKEGISNGNIKSNFTSKWSTFIDNEEEQDVHRIETEILNGTEYVLEIPKLNKRKHNDYPSKSSCKSTEPIIYPTKDENVHIAYKVILPSAPDINMDANQISQCVTRESCVDHKSKFKINPVNANSKWFKYVNEMEAPESDLNDSLPNTSSSPPISSKISPTKSPSLIGNIFSNVDDNLDEIFNL